MDIRVALLALLGTIPLTACGSDCDDGPAKEDFTLENEELTGEQLEEILAAYPGEPTPRCWEACEAAYDAKKGWMVVRLDSCSLTLGAFPSHGGVVSCTGGGVEFDYFCE
jgi:hypothetical protein